MLCVQVWGGKGGRRGEAERRGLGGWGWGEGHNAGGLTLVEVEDGE